LGFLLFLFRKNALKCSQDKKQKMLVAFSI